ncbi:MAG: putative sensor protein [Frankiales bacterium]|nr:putative sensor protein [Frankiales bacterium]
MSDDVLLGEGPAGLRRARALVRERWGGTLPPDRLDTVVLLTSEVVTNAMLHAGGTVRLRLRGLPDRVRVEVRDRSPRLPQQRRVLDVERVSGRGLHLLRQLASRSGADLEAGGKVVWFEVAD